MSREQSALPDELSASLIEKSGMEGRRLKFSRSDPRLDHTRSLPRLLTAREPEHGRIEIVGSGWYGSAAGSPDITAVEASTTIYKAMTPKEKAGGKDQRMPEEVRAARRRDIVVYARGLWVPLFISLIVAALSIAGAVFTFLDQKHKYWIPIAILAVGALSAAVTAIWDISRSAQQLGN
jgi:hypothetical protein